MKKFYNLAILLMALVFASCDCSQKNVDYSHQLVGTWELSKFKTNNGTESSAPHITLTLEKSGQYIKYWHASGRYENGIWMYDGNKMLTLSHGEVSNNYYVTIKSSTLVLYMGDAINGTWTEETYLKPPTNKPQGGTAGAPAR